MARKRIADTPVLANWEQADSALREIAQNERQIADIEGDMNKQIEGVKIAAARAAKPYHDRIATLERDIKEFTLSREDEFKTKKTKTLNFGEVGFRQSTKVTLPKDKAKLAGIIRQLKTRRLRDCIKTEEVVLKDVLKTHGKETVVAVGAGWRQRNEFWYVTAQDKLEAIIE